MAARQTAINSAISQHLREKVEAAEASYKLAAEPDKVAALFRLDEAVQELGNALMADISSDQDG